MASGNKSDRIARETLSLDEEQRRLAEHLLTKSGVDFRALDRKALFDALSGLVSPFDYALWAVMGFVAGAVYVWALWTFVATMPVDVAARGLFGLLAFALAVGFGLFVAGCSVSVYAYRTVQALVRESFESVTVVRREIKSISPAALTKLSAMDVARGTVWIVAIPVIELLFRRRLKLRVLTVPPTIIVRRAFRLILPPMAISDGQRETSDARTERRASNLRHESPGTSNSEHVEDAGRLQTPRAVADERGLAEAWSTAANNDLGESSPSAAASPFQQMLERWLVRLRNFGAVVFGGLALIQGLALALLAWLIRVIW